MAVSASRFVTTALSSSSGSSSRGGGGSGIGISGSGKWPFLTGLLLGAGVASVLHAFLTLGNGGGGGSGSYHRRAGSSSHPFSFIASNKDLVAVR
jgi:hypothetical protein